jgi:hypothetical protein
MMADIYSNKLSSGSKCAVCGMTQKELMRCAKCKRVKYCGVDCQKKDYPSHKLTCKALKTTYDLLELIREFWDFLLLPGDFVNVLTYYYGEIMVDHKKRVIFGKLLSDYENLVQLTSLKHDRITVRDWYTSPRCLPTKDGHVLTLYPMIGPPKPMTNFEFYRYWTTGKCTMISICLGVLIKTMCEKDMTITYNGKKVVLVEHAKCTMTVNFNPIVHCYEPLPLSPLKPFDEWDCDVLNRVENNKHECIIIGIEDEQTDIKRRDFIVDLAASQYDIRNNVTGFDDYSLYIEELNYDITKKDDKYGDCVDFSKGEIDVRANPIHLWQIYQMDYGNQAYSGGKTLQVIKDLIITCKRRFMPF